MDAVRTGTTDSPRALNKCAIIPLVRFDSVIKAVGAVVGCSEPHYPPKDRFQSPQTVQGTTRSELSWLKMFGL